MPPHVPKPSPYSAEEQIRLAMSLLELYGAPSNMTLWRAIDHAVTSRDLKIIRLEAALKATTKGK